MYSIVVCVRVDCGKQILLLSSLQSSPRVFGISSRDHSTIRSLIPAVGSYDKTDGVQCVVYFFNGPNLFQILLLLLLLNIIVSFGEHRV